MGHTITVENYFRTTGDLINHTFYGRARHFKYHNTVDDRASEAKFDDVLKFADEILVDVNDSSMRSAVFLYGEVVCKIYCFSNDGNYSWHVASDNHAKMKSLEEKLLATVPITTANKDRVPLTFWTLGALGATSRNRRIVVPDWPDIQQNYPAEVGDSLSHLMEMKPGKSGQLIMFHGIPGTGKSYAIRALLKQWNSWCKGEYIVDPEKFFGGSAEYMISVLLGNNNSSYDEPTPTNGEGSNSSTGTSPWHLYIVEDSDELLTDDAKERSGQALSRLLNVVDGMIGQGLQVLVLVTTNEPMERIHPAVKRPGRCLANIEFRKFNKQEAGLWLDGDRNKIITVEDKTLAELYHERGDVYSLLSESDKSSIGFGAAI